MKSNYIKHTKLFTGVAAAIALSTLAIAEDAQKFEIDIQSQSIGKALRELAKDTGIQIIIPNAVGEKFQSPILKGQYTVTAALEEMLKSSGLKYEFRSDDSVVIKQEEVDTDAKNKEPNVEEVVVTGSRIARPASQMAANVITLTTDDLLASGESTLEGALRQLPQNVNGASPVGAAIGSSFNGAKNLTGASSVNLRGVGGESTLALIDGRKIGKSGVYGGISDITGIPLSSIERVEIMLDGASAIYGSDAVGGVVNVITKKDYEGGEIKYEFGKPEDGGFEEHILSFSGSKNWENGSIHGTYEHFERSNLDGGERPEIIGWSTNTAPGIITSGNPLFYRYNGQNYLPSELAGLGLTTSSPGVEGYKYAQIPTGMGNSWTVNDIINFGNSSRDVRNPDASYGKSLIPAQERDTAQIGFEQSLFDNGNPITLSGNFYYSKRKTEASQGNYVLSTSRDIPTSSSVNRFETPVYVNWDVPSMGLTRYSTDQSVMRWNLGLDGEAGDSWKWSTTAGQTKDRIDSGRVNSSIETDYYSNPAFRSLLDDQGLDLFSDNLLEANNQELLDMTIRPELKTESVNKSNYAEFNFNGSLFDLPGGTVSLAAGGEWRQEILETSSASFIGATRTDVDRDGGPGSGYDEIVVSRTQHSGFLELLIPVVGADNAVPLIESLNITGAGRYDSYSKFGGESTWSLGAVWKPAEEVTVRVNHSTSYIVPTPRDSLIDPYSFDFFFPIEIYDEAGNSLGYNFVDFATSYTDGGNPDLEPEYASSLIAGVTYEPLAIPGLRLSATWHQTEYTNRISPFTGLPFVLSPTNNEFTHPDNIINLGGGNWHYDVRPTNIASLDVSGVDYDISYTRDTDIGEFYGKLNIAYTDKWDRVQNPGSAVINQVKSVQTVTQRAIPAYRYSANFGWRHNGMTANLDLSTASNTESIGTTFFGTLSRVSKPALLADLIFSYDFGASSWGDTSEWLSDTLVSLRVNNVLNDNPEYSVTYKETGEPADPEFNPNLADPRGRMVYLSLTKRF